MEETKEGGTCENCGMEYSYINFRNPNRRCLHCGLVGFGSRLTPGAADDAKKMLVKQVEAWLTDYEMPMSAYMLRKRGIIVNSDAIRTMVPQNMGSVGIA